jgi:hypothetical protein
MSANTTTQFEQIDSNRRYPIPKTLALLGISRKRFYDNVKAGRIKIIKDGRRSFCGGDEIIRVSRTP